MPAPKGNQFWKARSSHGRNPKFKSAEDLWKACEEYFEWIEDNPLWDIKPFSYQGVIVEASLPKMRAMTIGGLCTFLDICEDTWASYREREDFVAITTRVDRIIRTQKFEGAAAELLNANIIARELGLAERNEHSGPGGGPIRVKRIEEVIIDPED